MRTLRVTLLAGVLVIAGALGAVSSSLAASSPSATTTTTTGTTATTTTGTTATTTTAPGSSAPTTTTTTAATKSTVAIGGRMGFVSPGSPIVGIWVSCLNGTTTCTGTLSLSHDVTIASRSFTLKPGAAGFVHLTLTAHGLALLHTYQAMHQLLGVTAKISGTSISHSLYLAEWTHNGSK